MPDCWNCGFTNRADDRFCGGCGSPLRPLPEEERRVESQIFYLLRESAGWSWLAEEQRRALRGEYEARLVRLKEAAHGRVPVKPATHPAEATPPVPVAEPTPPAPVPADAQPLEPAPPPTRSLPRLDAMHPAGFVPAASPTGPVPPAPAPQPASSFLEVRTIRWFLMLGGLLLLAGFIGFLRGEWQTLGRYVVTGALLATPVLSFVGAWKLRASLPISSRLLSIVGGLLLPVGLLALHRFGFTSDLAAWESWATLSFGISAAVLLTLAALLVEPAALHLGTLSLVLAAAYLQRALGAHHGVFGGTAIIAAFAYLAIADGLRRAAADGSTETSPEPGPSVLDLRRHLLASAQLLATLSLVSTLPAYGQRFLDGPAVFLVGAVFFASVAFLMDDVRALYASGAVSVGFAAFTVAALDVPAMHAAFFILAIGTTYLGLARGAQPAIHDTANHMAVGLVAGTLFLLFGHDLLKAIIDGFDALPPEAARSSLAVALLSAAWFAGATALVKRPSLVYGVAISLAYAELMAVVILGHGSTRTMPLPLALFPLAVLAVEQALRRVLPSPFLEPALDVAAWVALIPAPLALAQDAGTAIVAAVVALFYLLLAARGGRPRALYLAAISGSLSYASAFHPDVAHFGLVLIPLAAVLAVGALLADARHGRAFSLPLARSAWVLAWIILLVQPAAWSAGDHGIAAGTVAATAACLAAFSRPFRGWGLLGHDASSVLAASASLLLPAIATVALQLHQDLPRPGVEVLALLVAMRVLGSLVPDRAWAQGLRTASLVWTPVLVLQGRDSVLMALAPAAVWMLDAGLGRTAGSGWAATALAAVGVVLSLDLGPLEPALARAAILAVLAIGWVLLVDLSVDFLVPAWLAAGYAWVCALHAAGIPADHLGPWLIPFNLLLVAALARFPSGGRERSDRDLLERLACVTAAVAMAVTLGHPAAWAPTVVMAAYAGGFALASRYRQSHEYETIAWTLVPIAWIAGCLRSGGGGPVEWITLPVGIWLLIWSHRRSPLADGLSGPRPAGPRWQSQTAARPLLRGGTLLVLLPSLLGSLGDPHGIHTVWTGVTGLCMLLYGTATRRASAMIGGSVALLAEAILQAHLALVTLPWQYYASVVGALLISLSLLFERLRQNLNRLGQRLQYETRQET